MPRQPLLLLRHGRHHDRMLAEQGLRRKPFRKRGAKVKTLRCSKHDHNPCARPPDKMEEVSSSRQWIFSPSTSKTERFRRLTARQREPAIPRGIAGFLRIRKSPTATRNGNRLEIGLRSMESRSGGPPRPLRATERPTRLVKQGGTATLRKGCNLRPGPRFRVFRSRATGTPAPAALGHLPQTRHPRHGPLRAVEKLRARRSNSAATACGLLSGSVPSSATCPRARTDRLFGNLTHAVVEPRSPGRHQPDGIVPQAVVVRRMETLLPVDAVLQPVEERPCPLAHSCRSRSLHDGDESINWAAFSAKAMRRESIIPVPRIVERPRINCE